MNRFDELARSDVVGRHALEPDPEGADAILFVDVHLGEVAALLEDLPRHPVYGAQLGRAYAYNVGDSPVYTLPGVYVGASPRWPRRLPVVGGPYVQLMAPVPPAAQEPDLLFSFRGGPTHPIRDAIFAIRHERAVVEQSDVTPWADQPRDVRLAAAMFRHIKLVHRSKFVLCPRGHGPSSHRLFETLGAGRVPVVISDNWLPPPGVLWEECAVRIAEADVDSIVPALEAAEPRWEALALNARRAAETFDTTRLWDHLCESVAMLSAQPRPKRLPWWAQAQRLRLRLRRARDQRRSHRQ
jgi:hypothetical protein